MTRAARRPQAVRGEILSPAEAARYLASGDPTMAEARPFFDPALDPMRPARDAAALASQRLESFGAERAPGLVAIARAHPVTTFGAGLLSGATLAWIFGGSR